MQIDLFVCFIIFVSLATAAYYVYKVEKKVDSLEEKVFDAHHDLLKYKYEFRFEVARIISMISDMKDDLRSK